MSATTRHEAPTDRCVECDAPIRSPFLTGGLEVCEHRRACEGRQMLQAGRPVMDAARHAQGLNGGGFWEEMGWTP